MAPSSRVSKPPKPTRSERSEQRAGRRAKRRDTLRNLRQAFVITKQNDPRFLPLLIISTVVTVAVVYIVVLLVTGSPYFPIALAVIVGLLVAMFVFTQRAQRSMYTQAEGQAGAAGWLLQQRLRGDWRLTQAVAGTTQLDVVHRLVGRPGVVLIGEGAAHRVRGLLAQEKKRTARVVGDTPIYDITVGTGEGDIRLARLNRYLLKLPANLSKEQVGSVDKRLSALGGSRAAMPQGPVPQGAKIRNVQRTVRRRT